ncbi:Vesicular glutamate transporter 3 [Zootermopsis nevadensis]|uniref:Vesicular glutamate transporter 3 n=1 Tax=Zootermopsis nevadensis TaxID=136037 RepID=A0A067QSB3_ZOONE|nr:Vesicular glutamate transporter 3 [Zootermopsis nevadensis]
MLNRCQNKHKLFKNTHRKNERPVLLVFIGMYMNHLMRTIFMYIHVLLSAQGAMYSATHAAIAHWSPPNEKSKFLWCTIGGTFGTMVAFPLCGAILNFLGWQAAFYVTSGLMLIVCLAWSLFMYNTPQEHPQITQDELQYIQNANGYISKNRKPKFPVKKVFTSVPVIALVILQIGDVWGLFLAANYGPKFMKEALGFDLLSTGGLAALPHMSRLIFWTIFSAVTDSIHAMKLMSITRLRKTMTIFSHLVPAIFLFLVGELGCMPYISIMCLVLCLGFNGAAVGSCLANPHDLTPNFAGTIFGIQNGVASIFSAMSGFIVGAITKEKNGLAEWKIIWETGAAVYIFTAILFFMWGTGERQEWNDSGDSTVPEDNSKAASQQTPET